MNANCHAHKTGCPYSCNIEQPKPNPKPQRSLPIGGLDCLFGFIIIYLAYKLIKRNLWIIRGIIILWSIDYKINLKNDLSKVDGGNSL